MKKIFIITAILLIFAGVATLCGLLFAANFNFSKFATFKYTVNTYTVSNDFKNISINAHTADVVLKPSENGEFKVECSENEKIKYSVSVENETLNITVREEKKPLDLFNISWDSPLVTLYLPLNEYGSLHIDNSTGDISVPENFSFESIDIKASTSDIKLGAISTGDITITVSTGDIVLENCDARNIYIKTSTGDVTGTLLSEKFFVTETSTGDINVPKTTSGGRCEIKTSTGDINIKISDK